MNLLLGQRQPKQRRSLFVSRHVNSAATPGHHMSAGTSRPKPVSRWPDQMIGIHSSALKTNVSFRYTETAWSAFLSGSPVRYGCLTAGSDEHCWDIVRRIA